MADQQIFMSELATEKSTQYRGSASIKLEVLHFEHEQDLKNARKLELLFRKTGYDHLDVQNHVPAIIDKQTLETAVRDSGLTAEMLRVNPGGSYPKLDFPPGLRLECLHGQDRVQAAARLLPKKDRRWIVDLYLADIAQHAKTTLIEEYSCEKLPDDGEFYNKIRWHQRLGNEHFEQRWHMRLRITAIQKWKNLKRVLKHSQYRFAFDTQLDMPGLAGGMSLGTLHKMFSMRCDELKENLHYLKHVRNTWSAILNNDIRAMKKLDRHTVKAVELTAPGACRQEEKKLYKMVQIGQIFGGFDEKEREEIWRRVLAVSMDRLIPSLFSFFADINYLQRPAECMKQLLDPMDDDPASNTLKSRFADAIRRADTCMVQVSETTLVDRPGSAADQFDLAYRVLWLSAMRVYKDIPPQQNKTAADLLAKPETSGNESVLSEFAGLAYQVRFDTGQIRSLTQRSADREIARTALLKARDQRRFRYDTDAFEKCVEIMVSLFNKATKVEEDRANSEAEIRYVHNPRHRCGLPTGRDYQQDQSLLFLDKLHSELGAQAGITPFFVRRSVYLAFFGQLNGGDSNNRAINLAKTGSTGGSSVYLQEITKQAENERQARCKHENIVREREERVQREREEEERVQREREEEERVQQRKEQLLNRKDPLSLSSGDVSDSIMSESVGYTTVTTKNSTQYVSTTGQQSAEYRAEEGSATSKVRIDFVVREAGQWKVDCTVFEDPKNMWEFKRRAIKYKRKGMVMKNSEMKLLSIDTFVGDVIKDETYTVRVVDKTNLDGALQSHQDGPRRKLRSKE